MSNQQTNQQQQLPTSAFEKYDATLEKLKRTSPYDVTLREVYDYCIAAWTVALKVQFSPYQKAPQTNNLDLRLRHKAYIVIARWLFGHPAHFRERDPLRLFALLLVFGGVGAAYQCRRSYAWLLAIPQMLVVAVLAIALNHFLVTIAIIVPLIFYHAFIALFATHQLWCQQHGLLRQAPKPSRWQIDGGNVTFH